MPSVSKKIGLISMILLCVNGMVGSGLFLLPGQVASSAGMWGCVVYTLVAALIMAIGWCYIQCASHFTKNGGAYLYAKEAFGDCIGFQVGLMRWIVGMISWASLTCGFFVALTSIWPELAPWQSVFVAFCISILSIVNLYGAHAVKKLNNIITVTKVVLLVFFVFFGLFSIKVENLSFKTEAVTCDSFGAAALIVFFAFSGFEALCVIAEELENPKKNIPIAMVTGIVFCSLLYLTVQLICQGTLGDALSGSSAPLADVASVAFGQWAKLAVSSAMIISIGGVMIVSSFITPRSGNAVAEDHRFFSKLCAHNRFDAPYMAIIISCLITVSIALSGGFLELVKISVVSRFVQHTTTCLALFAFKRKGVLDPFPTKAKKAIPLFALSGIIWLLSQAHIYHISWGLGALIVGIPLYFLQEYLDKRRVEA